MIAPLQPYLVYKNSGVEWLGKVPAHWDVRRLKDVATLIMGQSPSSEDCSTAPIGLPFLQGCAEFGSYHPRPVQFCRVPAKVSPVGAILLSVRAPVGRFNLADQMYGIGRGLCAVLPRFSVLDPFFCRYSLWPSQIGLMLRSTGSTYDAVSVDDVACLPALVPPIPEQAAIVRFLDHADRRIRLYIRAKEKLIALLEEQKQAIIHEAVTGQIDVRTGRPHPAYKPSRVEELGDVPEHWEVVALKRMLTRLIDCEHKTAPAVSASDNYVVRTTAVRAGAIRWEGTYCTDSLSYMEWTRRGVPQVGDVIFTREAPAGEACLVPEGRRVCLGQRTVLLKPRPTRYDAAFLVHMIYAGPPRLRVQLASQGSTVGHFNVDDIGWMPVLAPPL